MSYDNDIIEAFEHAGLTIQIVPDGEPENPRDFMGTDSTILCREHNRYRLGDEQSQACSPEEMLAEIKAEHGPTRVALPVWFYDHSIQAMSVRPFTGRAQHAEWDSAWAGFIFMTDAQIREVYIAKRITKRMVEEVTANLTAQVEVYSDYLSGNTFGYVVIDPDTGEELDCCFGFYGWADVIAQAKEAAEGHGRA
jgi:hypothetical protein